MTRPSHRRILLELSVGYALILAVIWTPRPWQHLFYWAPVFWIGTVTWLSFTSLAEMGLRTTNLLRSLWIPFVAAVLASFALLLAAHRGTLHAPATLRLLFATYIGYAIWSFVQQLLLLDFFLRRFLLLLPGRPASVASAALIFALAHLPNPVLTPLTLLWGAAACLLFLHFRNVFPLALAHAIFGITVAVSLPVTMTHNMRVGLGYLRFHPRHVLQPGAQRSHTDQIVSTQAWVRADAPTLRS